MQSNIKKQMQSIAGELNYLRRLNQNKIPKDVFPIALDIGGAFPTIEVILKVKGVPNCASVFALKKREKEDQGWQNMYHLIGTVFRKHDTPELVHVRLAAELSLPVKKVVAGLRFYTPMLYYGKPRNATGLSLLYTLTITARDFSNMDKGWRLFKDTEIKKAKIIEYHKRILDTVSTNKKLSGHIISV